MSGKTSKNVTRGLQLSCGGPKCLSVLSGISLRCLRGPWGGPWLPKGQHPQPDQVQEAYVMGAEGNQHAHQGSGSHYSGGGNDQIPALFMASIHRNQQETALTLFIALFIEFVCDRPRLLAGTVGQLPSGQYMNTLRNQLQIQRTPWIFKHLDPF